VSRPLIPVVLALAAGLAACTAEAAPAPAGDEVQRSVIAQDMWFEPTRLQVPPGRGLAITLDNRDSGTPHDLALMAGPTFATKLGASEIVTGPARSVLRVPGLVPGVYRLICEVHPMMTVDLEVRDGL
jgi:plastocyanin